MIRLAELLAAVPGAALRTGQPDTAIVDIVSDSRAARPGTLFVAIQRHLTAFFAFTGQLARLAASLLPQCPFHALTGVPCPTCGTGRACIALAEGRFLDAILMNPLAVVGGALFLGYIGGGLLAYWRTGIFPEPRFSGRRLFYLRVVMITLILTNWFYLYWTGI